MWRCGETEEEGAEREEISMTENVAVNHVKHPTSPLAGTQGRVAGWRAHTHAAHIHAIWGGCFPAMWLFNFSVGMRYEVY